MIVPKLERDRHWPLWVERMAITGLVADDTVGTVVHEMANGCTGLSFLICQRLSVSIGLRSC